MEGGGFWRAARRCAALRCSAAWEARRSAASECLRACVHAAGHKRAETQAPRGGRKRRGSSWGAVRAARCGQVRPSATPAPRFPADPRAPPPRRELPGKGLGEARILPGGTRTASGGWGAAGRRD